MTERKNWNTGWKFSKEKKELENATVVLSQGVWEEVDLPHTWNGKDGQDGGDDYYRGSCCYVKKLSKADLPRDTETYLEFEGANSSADVYINGIKAAHHDGGYSTWRVNVTGYLREENEVAVVADNTANGRVYPQMADFTFYGGLYRNVNLLSVGKKRFDLDFYGGSGIWVTPEVKGDSADVETKVWLTGTKGGEELRFTVMDEEEIICGETMTVRETEEDKSAQEEVISLTIPKVHLWNGRKDPHLYTMKVTLLENGHRLDEREVRFGCRTFFIDPQRGFILNGEPYPLRGVARHQDRPDIGNALSPEHHIEDMDLICEMGANTIRLAHYQHDQYFYDLCDERGMVVWAEIPYISSHMTDGTENTRTQMLELIEQNYNHPSIVVWGLSNEITMSENNAPGLVENHQMLNELAHRMDATRLTTMAIIGGCSMDNEYVRIPDVKSYNLYKGWYDGTIPENGEFLDRFHEKYPNEPIGLSEYGCDASDWHTSKPRQGDYTEEYQAYFHEEMIRQLEARPYLWATHVWNMFDFAADARSEGGTSGLNMKGLVTFDRKYRKDAYFAYKAWLSDEPFVHICGKRYTDRVEEIARVTVYSNQPEVELYANGKLLEKQKEKYFFCFDVQNIGETVLTAKAGDVQDESRIRKVEKFNEAYLMKESGDVLNWYEITEVEGHFSLNDKICDIMATEEGKRCLGGLMAKVFGGMKRPEENDGNRGNKTPESGADATADAENKASAGNAGVQDAMKNAMGIVSAMTVKRFLSVMATRSEAAAIGKEGMLKLNEQLNQIAKK